MSDLSDRLGRAFEFAAGQVKATVGATPDYALLHPRRPLEARRPRPGRLVVGPPRGDDVADRLARPLDPAGGPARGLQPPAQPEKHDRACINLGFVFLPTYLPGSAQDSKYPDRQRRPRHRRGPLARPPVQPRGKFLPLVRAREPVDRHDDERADHLPRRERDRRRAALRPGRRPLPDDRAHARQARRRRCRRPSSTWRRASSSASDPSGITARSVWASRPGVVINGFITVYRLHERPGRPGRRAEQVADYFLGRCPASQVPPWDFDVPDGPDRIDDSSARLDRCVGLARPGQRGGRSARPAAIARRRRPPRRPLHRSLRRVDDPDWEGVVRHGVYQYNERGGVDESVMWGDFLPRRRSSRRCTRPECAPRIAAPTATSAPRRTARCTPTTPATTTSRSAPGRPRGRRARPRRMPPPSLHIVQPDEIDEELDEDVEVDEAPRTVLITGANGNLGRKLREAWGDVVRPGPDRPRPIPATTEVIVADLADWDESWVALRRRGHGRSTWRPTRRLRAVGRAGRAQPRRAVQRLPRRGLRPGSSG